MKENIALSGSTAPAEDLDGPSAGNYDDHVWVP